jgi:hypothetical protein
MSDYQRRYAFDGDDRKSRSAIFCGDPILGTQHALAYKENSYPGYSDSN